MKKVKCAIERTVQVHQFEPVKINLVVEEEIDDNYKQWFEKIYKKIDSLCNKMLQDQIDKYR